MEGIARPVLVPDDALLTVRHGELERAIVARAFLGVAVVERRRDVERSRRTAARIARARLADARRPTLRRFQFPRSRWTRRRPSPWGARGARRVGRIPRPRRSCPPRGTGGTPRPPCAWNPTIGTQGSRSPSAMRSRRTIERRGECPWTGTWRGARPRRVGPTWRRRGRPARGALEFKICGHPF